MKKTIDFPPNFTGINKVCGSCTFISKVQKTNTAYCTKHAITFPLYESTLFYICDNHTPVAGEWGEELPLDKNGLIVNEEKK